MSSFGHIDVSRFPILQEAAERIEKLSDARRQAQKVYGEALQATKDAGPVDRRAKADAMLAGKPASSAKLTKPNAMTAEATALQNLRDATAAVADADQAFDNLLKRNKAELTAMLIENIETVTRPAYIDDAQRLVASGAAYRADVEVLAVLDQLTYEAAGPGDSGWRPRATGDVRYGTISGDLWDPKDLPAMLKSDASRHIGPTPQPADPQVAQAFAKGSDTTHGRTTVVVL